MGQNIKIGHRQVVFLPLGWTCINIPFILVHVVVGLLFPPFCTYMKIYTPSIYHIYVHFPQIIFHEFHRWNVCLFLNNFRFFLQNVKYFFIKYKQWLKTCPCQIKCCIYKHNRQKKKHTVQCAYCNTMIMFRKTQAHMTIPKLPLSLNWTKQISKNNNYW